MADDALAQVDDDDEAEAAIAVARKKLRQTASLDRAVRIRRALGALGRKGYASGVAMQAIQTVLAEEPAVLDDDLSDGPSVDEDWMEPEG